MKSTGGGGEIIQVQGGHILRSTGRKDRHSKVYTAKGPRDRRVRLAAHTAIQFYDVQDRLGYDRPSKAVDWLIKKAQSAIDKLAELPPWNPCEVPEKIKQNPVAGPSEIAIEQKSQSQSQSSGFEFHVQTQFGEKFGSGFDSIAETMKSFFPTSSETNSMNFQSYPHGILSRNTVQNEDLCLSLQSLQDPNQSNQALFSGESPAGFDGDYRQGFIFHSIENPQNQFLNHGSAFSDSQREPLQSSFITPSFRDWNEHSIASSEHQNSQNLHQSLIYRSQFATEARVEHDLASSLPYSASPN